MKRGMSACERIEAAVDVIFGAIVAFFMTTPLLFLGVGVADGGSAVMAVGFDATAAAAGGSGDRNGRGSCILTVIFCGGGGKRDEERRDLSGDAADMKTF